MDEQILQDLNPPQREAVESLQGPLLILAGAGSGKTRVVTRRIANLIAHGVRPWQIVAITFTNKAAGEMRRRVERVLGAESAAGMWLSTFHSLCARILRREGETLGYSRDFTIYDEEDSSTLLKEIIKRLGLNEDKRFTPRNMRQMISQLKNQARQPEAVGESLFHERLLKQIYQEYQAQLKKNQALDFDDLLSETVRLFRDHTEVLERYQDRLRYVLVDEYQDTNGCQYQLVKMLGQKHRNVCATGDPDQSIYAWRGADVRNILSFEQDFPEAKVVKLEQNYRSTQLILDAASRVIAHNTERKKKELWTENGAGEPPSFKLVENDQYEAIEVAQQIDRYVREGRRYSDVAVFYRTNSQSRTIEEALRNNIPYQIVGGITFYERKEVKDALAYLRLIINPKDDVAFRRVLNVPRRGLGDSALELIEKEAAQRGASLSEALDGHPSEAFVSTFKGKARLGLIHFARALDKLRQMPSFPVEPLLKCMLSETGLLKFYADAGEEERLENLDSLVNAAAEFDEENDPQHALPEGPPPEPGAYDGIEELAQQRASLSGFLEKISLLAPTDELSSDDDRVTLMTLHMAKGLEFPVVFITGLEDGLLPLVRNSEDHSGEDARSIEEERRLMYVGMTRARERLHLLRARFRRRFGKSEMTMPSRFLSEIPKELLQSRAPRLATDEFAELERTQALRPSAQDKAFGDFEREVDAVFGDEQQVRSGKPSSRRSDPALQQFVDRLLDVSETQDQDANLEIGDRVRHAKFGVGTIEALTGTGLSAKVRVHFRDCGPKQLLISLAKLEKI